MAVTYLQTPVNCQHNKNTMWGSQSWTRDDDTGKEKCDFCGFERWQQPIRNAVNHDKEGMLFGRAISKFDPEMLNLYREIRDTGAFVDTNTVHDPNDGKLWEAKAIIFFEGRIGPTYLVRTSVDPFQSLMFLRNMVYNWYGKEVR